MIFLPRRSNLPSLPSPRHPQTQSAQKNTCARTYLDGFVGGGAEPVVAWGEAQAVDGAAGVERIEVLALADVPQHSNAVLATGGAERPIGGDGDGVEHGGMADKVCGELAGR